ncbi:hypothetical protein [Chitinilyticum litopenaei]|uniref:hypothetical protein n=1 Tax=Chitinilyticum litopenaei TaxID=1121276 RepID=UPI0011853BCF|nr:hypothetical protein [Chitinilyticum litopenaei]
MPTRPLGKHGNCNTKHHTHLTPKQPIALRAKLFSKNRQKHPSLEIFITLMNAESQPIDGRNNHIGGIESIIIDDTTYYFGFDYGSDLVISPLIGSSEEMARFAAQHMLQKDGPHDITYWIELTNYDSELCEDEASRTFRSEELRSFIDKLDAVELQNTYNPDCRLEYHLLYLLGAASDWAAGDIDKIENELAILRGETPISAEDSYSKIAASIKQELTDLVHAAPENWRSFFSYLAS